MNFDLTEEQTMLRSLVQRYVAEHCGIERLREARAAPSGFCQGNWEVLADIGLLGALLPKSMGGMELGPVELAVIFQELGRGLAAEPLADAVVGAGFTFASCADKALVANWGDAIGTGRKRLALAFTEQATRYNSNRAETRLFKSANVTRLVGQKVAVPHAIGAAGFIVSAADGEGTVQLFLVDANATGLELVPYRQIDGSIAAVMHLRDVEPVGQLSGGIGEIRMAEARLSLARSAEALGIMDLLVTSTLDYLRQRHQFGQPIGSFQAIQHRMAAQYVALEQARSLLYWAITLDAGDSEEWIRSVAGLRSFVLDAAVKLGHEAIQLHGGMGVTDELAIGHAHKRLVQIARSSEPPNLTLDRYAGLRL